MSSFIARTGTIVAALYISQLAAAGAGTLNQWQNIHPSGPANSVGGYMPSGIAFADGRAIGYSLFNRLYQRSGPDSPWMNYVPMVDGATATFVVGFFSVPSTPDLVFGYARIGRDDAIVRSDDSGNSWTALLTYDLFDGLGAFAVAPSNPSIIYANSNIDGFLKTVDGGSTWFAVTEQPLSLRDIQVDAETPTVLYALDNQRIVKSVNSGLGWTPSDDGVHPVFDYMDDLTVDLYNPGTLYAGSGGTGLIFKSTDGAETWTQIGLPPSLNRGPVNSVAVDPSNPSIVYALSGGGGDALFYRSPNGGVTWEALDDPDEMADFGNISISPVGDVMYFGATGAGILDGAGAMRASNLGFSDFGIQAVRVAPGSSDRIFGLGADGGLMATNPTAPLWENRRIGMGPDARDLHIDPQNGDHLLANGLFGLYESLDEGRNWIQIDVPGNSVISQLEVAPDNASVIHLRALQGLVSSVDGGLNWYVGLASDAFPAGGLYGTLAVATGNGERAYIGSEENGLFGTVDSGQSWAQIDTPFTSERVTDIAADPNLAGAVYVSTEFAIWHSDATGSGWIDISGGQDFDASIYSMAVDAVVPGRVFVETSGFRVWALDPRVGTWSLILTRPQSGSGGFEPRELLTADPIRSGRLLHSLGEVHEVQLDSDFDGVSDDIDSCILTNNPTQLDADQDGLGNECDQDIAPSVNDCVVNFLDLNVLRTTFFTTTGDDLWNAAADFNGDGAVNFLDLTIMRGSFLGRPGYAAGSDCL